MSLPLERNQCLLYSMLCDRVEDHECACRITDTDIIVLGYEFCNCVLYVTQLLNLKLSVTV